MLYRKVSVIIPVYNSANSVSRAVSSVLYIEEVGEILLVDDGSKDGSLEICEELERKNEKIKLFVHPNNENLGASASRNLALKLAKFDWIQFLDADDELLPDKIKSQMERINPELSFIVGNSFIKDGLSTKKRNHKKDYWIGLFTSKLGHTTSNLWNRNFLFKIGGWNEKLSSSQEYDLMFRLLKKNPKIDFDENYNTIVHKTPGSISTSKKLIIERTKNWINLRLNVKEYLKKTNEFTLKRNYSYSGILGTHLKENNLLYNGKFSRFLFFLYSWEIRIKVFLLSFFNK